MSDAEIRNATGEVRGFVSEDMRLRTASACLAGKGYGFTHDDVAALRLMASESDMPRDWADAQLSLASRIAALLPPEGKR